MLPVASVLKERTMMSRPQKLIQLPLVGTILLCLLVGVYLFVWKRFSKSSRAAPVSQHAVETPAEDALKYWTADKKRTAKPAPLPNVTALERKKKHPRRSPPASRPPLA